MNKNPLPILLTSAGLVWLAASSRRANAALEDDTSSFSPRSGDFDRGSQSFAGTRVRTTADRLKRRATRTYDATREKTLEATRGVGDFIQEQPLVCGAIALAVGALIGAALPATEYERDLVARARDSAGPLLDQVSDTLRGTTSETPSSTISH